MEAMTAPRSPASDRYRTMLKSVDRSMVIAGKPGWNETGPEIGAIFLAP